MTTLILILVILNAVAGAYSVTGRRLRLSSHPVFVRIRYLGIGMVAALFLSDYPFTSDDWLSWLAVIVLALGTARFPERKPRRASQGDEADA